MEEKKLKALAELARHAGDDPAGRSAFAELIYEIINPNHVTLDVLNAFGLPTRTLNLGDQLVRRVRSGFPIRTFVPGTMHLADQIAIGEIYTYAVEYIIAKTRWSLWELQRGEIGTIDDFRREMEASLIDSIVSRVFNLLVSVWDVGTTSFSNFLDATSTGLTEDNLTNMMETVLYRSGNVKAIVGSRRALLPVYKFAGVFEVTATSPNVNGVVSVPSILEEWRQTGRIRTYKGAPLIELPQVFQRTMGANYDTKLIDDTHVVVVGDNAGEAILYGGVESQDSTDLRTEPPDYQLAMWRGFGMIVDRPEQIGVIKVAGTNPTALTYQVA
jgi:hypothetical protein